MARKSANKKKPATKAYTPTKDERDFIALVDRRFMSMQTARNRVDQNWGIYQEMIDAVHEPYGDERASSTVPLASSMIELFVAQSNKIPTEFMFKGETSKHSA